MHELSKWIEDNIHQFYRYHPTINACKNDIYQRRKKEELIEFAQASFREKKSHCDHKKRRGITSSVRKENKNRELDIDKDIEKNILFYKANYFE